ncbi:hypothetical protein L5515_009021 [Caenorhabditis briggsae]|uniref:Uncharacterized protein n=1 Tax=Caenorhabditis briggsae TaxID=6238 RepID=A0AAE9JLQ9_CAEBR|nr:hypothetical protein L5515_009021 [Caenorhabditis briggsae]
MSSQPQARNQGAPSFAESIIGVFSNGVCCKRGKNKVNPVTKEEEAKSEKKSSNSPGIQRSPTPGPEGRPKDAEPGSPKQKPLEVDSKNLKPDESSVTAMAGSVEENLPEQVNSKVDIEIVEPKEEDPPEPKNQEKEETKTQLSSTSPLRPLRPDGAGVRSSEIRSNTISRNPFPEYEGSSHFEHFSNESVCSIRELEEDELDIDDWGEGFESDRTPRAESKLTMQSNTETIRKRGLFQNKKSQAIETPPSSDRKCPGNDDFLELPG